MIVDWITDLALKNVLSEYKDFFKGKFGTLKDVQVTIPIDPSAKLKFYIARPLPYTPKK